MDRTNLKKICVRCFPFFPASNMITSRSYFQDHEYECNSCFKEYGGGKTWLDESTISFQVPQQVRLYDCNGIAIGYLSWPLTLVVQNIKLNCLLWAFQQLTYHIYIDNSKPLFLGNHVKLELCSSVWNHPTVILDLSAVPNYIFGYWK